MWSIYHRPRLLNCSSLSPGIEKSIPAQPEDQVNKEEPVKSCSTPSTNHKTAASLQYLENQLHSIYHQKLNSLCSCLLFSTLSCFSVTACVNLMVFEKREIIISSFLQASLSHFYFIFFSLTAQHTQKTHIICLKVYVVKTRRVVYCISTNIVGLEQRSRCWSAYRDPYCGPVALC